ncbi:LLM class flavin-dependent oxidoreductase [Paenibacillus lentus]|uniref:LLM class flavin-dependent oxidoreductase n=1 Tax=Paenibacillus lentus TaxID=1338368 RepID=A0A3S8RQB0_9BACL|nr:LLM class flavin-dependent oxidoreductase [Paenibacillus lentus]AZK45118.1 LLM class flavin-dependent oxidoreductase [Paenibacillus lentus]
MNDSMQNEHQGMEIGVYTLGDLVPDPYHGETISSRQRLQEMIQAAKLADEAGLDLFGVGEHHRLDYAASATSVILAAIAQATKRIKLTSATTVLTTTDPVRLFEEYATLDLLSNGRAEIIAGRGAFLESFPLFGYDLNDYDELFMENFELFQQLNHQEKVSWQGKFRAPLQEAEIAPRPVQPQIPMWIGSGGSLVSAERAGKLGTGMALAILGGAPNRFQALVEAYRETGIAAGHKPSELKVAITGHGYISSTTQQSKDEYYPYYANYRQYVDKQLGGSAPKLSRSDFEQMTSPETALFVGDPQLIIDKILHQYELFGHQRFMLQLDVGGIPFSKVAQSIELLATKVAPVVRKETGHAVTKPNA